MGSGSSGGGVLKRERVREHLLGLIEAGEPGDAIPSERTLCAELGVSRPTLRMAVDELVATGQLVREHGRGMFVAPAKITQELTSDDTAFVVPRASGAWSSRILERATIEAGARIGRKLRVSCGRRADLHRPAAAGRRRAHRDRASAHPRRAGPRAHPAGAGGR